MIPDDEKAKFCTENKYLLIATDVSLELKERGDAIEYKLENMVTKITVHTTLIESTLNTQITEAKDGYKEELQKTIILVKEENLKVFTLLEDLKARMAISEA